MSRTIRPSKTTGLIHDFVSLSTALSKDIRAWIAAALQHFSENLQPAPQIVAAGHRPDAHSYRVGNFFPPDSEGLGTRYQHASLSGLVNTFVAPKRLGQSKPRVQSRGVALNIVAAAQHLRIAILKTLSESGTLLGALLERGELLGRWGADPLLWVGHHRHCSLYLFCIWKSG